MPRLYAPSAIQATSSSVLSNGFNDKERLAASRGLIRSGLHKEFDIRHLSTRRPGGLHPSFFPAHPWSASQEEKLETLSFLDSSVGDVFDAVSNSFPLNQMLSGECSIQLTMQDRIDGGITLLLRSPGYRINEDIGIENIGIDVYFTPRELSEADPSRNANLAALVQCFGEDFALPHLRCFRTRCEIEDVRPPLMPGEICSSHSPSTTEPFVAYGRKLISTDRARLPPQVLNAGTHLRFLCLPHNAAPIQPAKDIDPRPTPSDADTTAPSDASTAVSSDSTESDPEWWQEASILAIDIERQALSPASHPRNTPPSTPILSPPSCSGSGDSVFPGSREAGATHFNSSELMATGLNCAIISIGPHTDRILDELGLEDLLILRLHQLVSTVRSSRWESVLRSSHYGLRPDQAACLNLALFDDLAVGIQTANTRANNQVISRS